MKLTNNIEASGLALYLEKKKTLVISDLHLGIESSMHRSGFLVPRFQFKEIKSKLEEIFEKLSPETIIINGDFKHEFGKIPKQEWREGLRMIDFLFENTDELILTKGNHDPVLFPIAEKRKVPIKEDGILIGSTYITHGDKIPKNKEFEKADTVIIGDVHPAVSLSDKGASEIYKCFLVGKFNDKKLLVQPSMSQSSIGSDVLKEKVRSPFLKGSLDNFNVFVSADKIMHFGKIKNLREQ
ncbi:MAG: metallophosphoesterase [Candidatus Undinarchaeales archaeon]